MISLQRLLNNKKISVERLLVSINKSTNRVSMHGVRKELIENQAEALGIPLSFIMLPENPSMDEYDSIMKDQMIKLKKEGFSHTAFGDIFLEDLREYREKQLNEIGMKSLFPIWGEDTDRLARNFIDDNFKAIFVCIDKRKYISQYAGELYSNEFLADIDAEIDPCGENGEFHTFVYDGPLFSSPISFRKGEIVDREYPDPEGDGKINFSFCDLKPS